MRSATDSPEQQLWAAVVLSAVNDLSGTWNKEGRSKVAEIASWVGSYPRRDFTFVCSSAGLDVDAAHKFFRRLLDMPSQERRAHCRALLGGEGTNQRRALDLHARGMSYREIAKVMGVTKSMAGKYIQSSREASR